MSFSGIEETKSKYSPPTLHSLCRSGQPYIIRDLRAGAAGGDPEEIYLTPDTDQSPILQEK